MPIRLALVNDYEVVVRGLGDMMRHYPDRVEVVELSANEPVITEVDIALYDTFTQTQAYESDVASLLANPRVVRVAVYTWNFRPGHPQAALQQGVRGYLSKALSAASLVEALESVHAGHIVVSDPPHRSAPQGGGWPGREETLTPRESEVVAMITQGVSNLEIAEQTSLSMNSIKSYIRSAYRKMGVSNRSNAILWGIEHGFRPDRSRVSQPQR